jgi:hypothetical protein
MNRLVTHLSSRWGEMLKKQCAWKNLITKGGQCTRSRPARASHFGGAELGGVGDGAYLATLGGDFQHL